MDGNKLIIFREKWKNEIEKKQDCSVVLKDGIGDRSSSTGHAGPCESSNSKSTGSLDHTFSEQEECKESSKTKCISCDKSNVRETQQISKKQKMAPVPLLTLDIPSYQITRTDGEHNIKPDPTGTHLPCSGSSADHHGDQDLISLLIRDIDEITAVPFFDISLPKEVCVKIFSQLDVKDLCHCACVSKTWSPLANDELIWHNIYKRLGFKHGGSVEEHKNWKGLVRESILRQQLVTRNWKERICQIQTLEYEKGGALCACQIYNNLLIAGYANGKTCLWNIETNWRHSLEPALEVFEDPAKASVDCVSVVGNVCATGFACGVVNVWHTEISVNPIYQYRLPEPAQHVVLASCQTPLVLTSSGSDIRVDQVQDEGQWGFVKRKSFDSQVTFVNLLPDESKTTFVIAIKEELVTYNARTDSLSDLDKIAGTKITAVTSSSDHIAVGWAPFGFGIGTEFTAKVRLYDTKTGRHLESFIGHYGDITCLNLSFKNGLVTGSKDKRVCVYDMRTERPQLSLRGHSSSITTVQMDSWKVVSGAFDGTLKVWDIRMGTVLWETRTTHPVQLCQFDSERLITVNIPLDKMPRESMWYADNLILHRKHRGTVQLYNFGTSCEPGVVPEEMTSNYDDIAGYNYNINLVAPYDALTSEIN